MFTTILLTNGKSNVEFKQLHCYDKHEDGNRTLILGWRVRAIVFYTMERRSVHGGPWCKEASEYCDLSGDFFFALN